MLLTPLYRAHIYIYMMSSIKTIPVGHNLWFRWNFIYLILNFNRTGPKFIYIIIRLLCPRACPSLQTQEPKPQSCSRAGLPPQTQEPRLRMDRCGTFPLLSAPHFLFSIRKDLKRSEEIPGAPSWRWGELIWLTRPPGLHRNSPQRLNISSIMDFYHISSEIPIILRPHIRWKTTGQTKVIGILFTEWFSKSVQKLNRA